MVDPTATTLAAKIELLLLDVDGVLTDGKFLFVPMPDGSVVEAKAFDAQDGSGIGLARRAGIKLGIISGRTSPAVTRRAEELRFHFCYQGLGRKKLEAFDEIARTSGLPLDRMCFVGDDLQDLPILRRVGFPVAVANACAEAKAVSAYVTSRTGGNGAVREIIELILRSQGKWDTVIAEFLQ
jgi:3-deoxy-D-manno-octulosonate 8-phosphate phosphatase (KDO 8-P phosphatase)